MTDRNIKRKCDSCGEWIIGKPRKCPICLDFVDHRLKEQEEKEAAKRMTKANEKAAFEAKSPFMQFMIKIGRVFYTIYMAIVSFIAWLLFWLGG